MGIGFEQYLNNLEAGLTAIEVPTLVKDRSFEANSCGSQVVMMMDFGAIQLHLDEQQQLLNVGAAYEVTQDLTVNLTRMIAGSQSIVALHGTEKTGESELGKLLFNAVPELMKQSLDNNGFASKDIEYGIYLYTVAVEGKSVAILARKKL